MKKLVIYSKDIPPMTQEQQKKFLINSLSEAGFNIELAFAFHEEPDSIVFQQDIEKVTSVEIDSDRLDYRHVSSQLAKAGFNQNKRIEQFRWPYSSTVIFSQIMDGGNL